MTSKNVSINDTSKENANHLIDYHRKPGFDLIKYESSHLDCDEKNQSYLKRNTLEYIKSCLTDRCSRIIQEVLDEEDEIKCAYEFIKDSFPEVAEGKDTDYDRECLFLCLKCDISRKAAQAVIDNIRTNPATKNQDIKKIDDTFLKIIRANGFEFDDNDGFIAYRVPETLSYGEYLRTGEFVKSMLVDEENLEMAYEAIIYEYPLEDFLKISDFKKLSPDELDVIYLIENFQMERLQGQHIANKIKEETGESVRDLDYDYGNFLVKGLETGKLKCIISMDKYTQWKEWAVQKGITGKKVIEQFVLDVFQSEEGTEELIKKTIQSQKILELEEEGVVLSQARRSFALELINRQVCLEDAFRLMEKAYGDKEPYNQGEGVEVPIDRKFAAICYGKERASQMPDCPQVPKVEAFSVVERLTVLYALNNRVSLEEADKEVKKTLSAESMGEVNESPNYFIINRELAKCTEKKGYKLFPFGLFKEYVR